MTRPEMIRVGALYFPILAACVAAALSGRPRRMFAACLLSVMWTAPALLLVQKWNAISHWWIFTDATAWLDGMPVELYVGWSIAWGIVPQIALRRLPVWLSIICLGLLDLALMPLCAPVVRLGNRWLVGEAICLLIVLVPSLCVARLTLENTHLRIRAWMQVAISGGVFLFLLPEIVFAVRPGRGWLPLTQLPSWERQVALQVIGLLALPGIGAVMEFAERGGGTPIPFDPPIRLVTSGIYRYVANPMQTCCTLVLLAWAILLRNNWLLLAPAISLIYSAGIAEWDEGQDMTSRFGKAWLAYRSSVRNWFPRWRPSCHGERARLYIAASCAPCSAVWRWIACRHPVGMEIVPAETLPYGTIRRMRYVPADGVSEEGVRALGRALEHLNVGWAIAGIALRLPGVWQFVQLVMDASGFGPRVPAAPRATCVSEPASR